MRIVIGADHAGFGLKQELAARLAAAGHEVVDLGTDSEDPVDYPDVSAAVGRTVASGDAERGIIVCGSGAGASIAANKITGVRAATIHDAYTAHQAVEHDDLNVLAMGSRVIGAELAAEIADTFIAARFSGEARHARRVAKIEELDRTRA